MLFYHVHCAAALFTTPCFCFEKRTEALFHIGDHIVHTMSEVGVCAQGQNSNAEAGSRSDKCFTNTAGDSDRSAGFQIKDTEGADHADNGTQKAQQRSHGNDDAQIVELVFLI